MKISQKMRSGWSVKTATSNLRFNRWDADGMAVFDCYSINNKGDRIEYRMRFSGTELRNIMKAPARDSNVVSMLEYLESEVE